MNKVKAKKHLGQHFLKDFSIAKDIASLYQGKGKVLEIGPGTGVLTQYLIENKALDLIMIELDEESVEYLKERYHFTDRKLIFGDFLTEDLHQLLNISSNDEFGLIGNFPYNISSQIFFKILDYKNQVTEVVGMLQKEVAERLASPPGNKDYGILSVLLQAYFDVKYEFTVYPQSFDPPPKVDSGVVRLVRNFEKDPDCDFKRLKLVVKTAFNQRRKMLSNALKPISQQKDFPYADMRAEQLDYKQFVEITRALFPVNP